MPANPNPKNKCPDSSFECGGNRHYITDTGEHTRDHIISGGSHGANRWRTTVPVEGGGGYRFTRAMWLEVEEHQFSYDDSANEANTAGYFILETHAEPIMSGGGANGAFYTTQVAVVRKVISYTPAAAGYYQLGFFHNQATMSHYVDKIQVEVGAVATDWEPMFTVEMGLVTDADYNTFFDGDTKQFKVKWWNDGAETTKLLIYDIYDGRTNEKLIAGSLGVVLPTGATTSTIALPTHNGIMRIMARIADLDCWDEITVCVIPAAAESGVNASGTFGGHTQASVAQITFLRKMGLTWTRTLSPHTVFRWIAIEPTEGAGLWQDANVTALAGGGMKVLGVIHGGLDKTGAPDWAHNPDNSLKLDKWAAFCTAVVARYKHQVNYWELWNEPLQSGDGGTPQAVWISVAANYASMVDTAVTAIIAEDATAKVVAMAGVPDEEWAEDVWGALSAPTKAALFANSCHLYPPDNGTDAAGDQNEPDLDPRPAEWAAKKAALGGLPIINSECATWNRGAQRGLNVISGFGYSGDWSGPPSIEWARGEEMHRSFPSVDRIMREILLCLFNFGVGAKAFQYDHRNVSLQQRSSTTTGAWEYTKTPRPTLAAIAIASSFIDAFTSAAKLVNAVASLTMGIFESGGRRVVVAWDYNRDNLQLATAQTGFTVYDVMGNEMVNPPGKIRIGRSPIYIASSTLTVGQITDMMEDSVVSEFVDIHPQNLSIDIAPSGLWGGGDATFKWGATDKTRTNSTAHTNVVEFRSKLDAGAWSAWGQIHYLTTSVAAGNHTLAVQSRDTDGNISEAIHVFNATASGPVNVTNPSTSGTEQVDGVLVMDPGSALGTADPVHRMAWLRKLP